jgi:hypothetical protein
LKEDIEIPIVKDVFIAMVFERNNEIKIGEWNAYLLNNGNSALELIFIVSKGFDGAKKTAVMRHSMEALNAKSYQKFEFVQDEVLALNNEFYLTYYANGKLYEKRCLFSKGSIAEHNLKQIPPLGKKGILSQ